MTAQEMFDKSAGWTQEMMDKYGPKPYVPPAGGTLTAPQSTQEPGYTYGNQFGFEGVRYNNTSGVFQYQNPQGEWIQFTPEERINPDTYRKEVYNPASGKWTVSTTETNNRYMPGMGHIRMNQETGKWEYQNKGGEWTAFDLNARLGEDGYYEFVDPLTGELTSLKDVVPYRMYPGWEGFRYNEEYKRMEYQDANGKWWPFELKTQVNTDTGEMLYLNPKTMNWEAVPSHNYWYFPEYQHIRVNQNNRAFEYMKKDGSWEAFDPEMQFDASKGTWTFKDPADDKYKPIPAKYGIPAPAPAPAPTPAPTLTSGGGSGYVPGGPEGP